MNIEYQELTNMILLQKKQIDISISVFVSIYICNLLIINNRSFDLLLNNYFTFYCR